MMVNAEITWATPFSPSTAVVRRVLVTHKPAWIVQLDGEVATTMSNFSVLGPCVEPSAICCCDQIRSNNEGLLIIKGTCPLDLVSHA